MSVATVREMQAAAWVNKLVKGFNTSDVPKEFCLLHGELAEAFDAWRHGRTVPLGSELADVAIYLFGLAEMTGVDLQQEIDAKLRINADRRYQADPRTGTLVKATDAKADPTACPYCQSTDRAVCEVIDEGDGPAYCDNEWHLTDEAVPGGDAR